MAHDNACLVEAMRPLFLGRLMEGGDPVEAEADLLRMTHEAACEAYARSLEAWDAALCSSLPDGTVVRDSRPRRLASRLGDVSYVRRVCRDRFGNPVVPLDDAMDLPERARLTPALEAEVVWLAAGGSYQRACDVASYTGSSSLTRTTVMRCVHRAGLACREEDVALAESLWLLGVKPAGEEEAEELCVESDGTIVRLQHEGDAERAEVKAMVAYAGKRRGGAGGDARKVERVRPVSFGCLGTAREMWTQGVAAVGSVYDVSSVRVVHTGFDGAGWCEGGSAYLRFAEEVVGHLDPFHANRAVARCFDADHADERLDALSELWAGDALSCADALESFAEDGAARPSVVAEVAPYLRAHAPSIGAEGPSLGTMEPENQHVYQSRLSSVPCAWTRRGADAVARIRSRQASGRAIPRRGRSERVPARTLARRQARVEKALAAAGPTASQVVQSEGRGWEYPTQATTSGMRADVRYESGLTADRKLGYPQ